MKTFAALILTFILLGLSGCSTTPISAAKKAGIKTVQIEPRVDSQQAMRYGVDLSSGGLANLLAGLLVDSLGQKGVSRMSAVMQTNEIIVTDLIQAHAVTRIQQYEEVKVAEENTDGVFVVKIVQYGFDSPGLKLSHKVPFVVLYAELLNREGKRLWSRRTTVGQLISKGMGATWEEYEADPQRLRADWNTQVENVVKHLFPDKKK
jgi:hypothetical protein